MEFIIDNFYLIIISALLFGFLMAYGIGANDVANAMGTSVGSKALTLTQALVIASIFTFMGAYFAGAEVTTTIRENIVPPELFNDDPAIFILGMLSSLLAAGTWLLFATMFGWPVSTTHSIIGAIAGFSIYYIGWSSVRWEYIGGVTITWLIVPFVAALLSGLIYSSAKRFIINAKDPLESGRSYIPVYAGLVGFLICGITLTKSLANTDIPVLITQYFGDQDVIAANIGISFFVALMCYGISRLILSHYLSTSSDPNIEGKFAVLMIFTACSIAFAHGSNDIANAVGPMAAIISTIENLGSVESQSVVPEWVLLTGAIGIVLGMLTLGYKVIRTVGEKITKLKPSKGFAAELSTAIIVLLGSISGIPLSTTHTLVGAVIGIGFFSGNKVNLKSVYQILGSWFVTVPGGAALAIIFFVLLGTIFGIL